MQRQFMQTLVEIIDQIKKEQTIHREQLQALLETTDEQAISYLRDTARKVADDIYGKQVFIRGLIEFTNYCKNDCIYCGIRRSNLNAQRYRLTEEAILSFCGINGPIPTICGCSFLMNIKSSYNVSTVCPGEPTINPQPT